MSIALALAAAAVAGATNLPMDVTVDDLIERARRAPWTKGRATLNLFQRAPAGVIRTGVGSGSPASEEFTLAVNRVPGAQDALCSAENDLLSMTLYMGGDVSEETLSRVRAAFTEINDGLPAYKRVQKLTLTPDPIPVSATGKKIRKL